MQYPRGYYSFGKNIGIKNETPDFAVIYSEKVCQAAAVFTKNNFPGAPVIVGREHVQNGRLQSIVINSKNSNVATGAQGVQDARETCIVLGEALGIDPDNILPSSTGVIGQRLPIEKILNACRTAKGELREGNLEEVARAIMTTDTRVKISSRKLKTGNKEGMIYGIAKGAGMIEPNMATMLSYIMTDFSLPGNDHYGLLRKAVDKSFNCISIDTDTSTSDTVVLLGNGLAGEIEEDIFAAALTDICIDLAKMVAADGEGATKLIQVDILNARDEIQARKFGKSIVNSPLVKTAIYGGDPNWGRLVMALGKVFDEPLNYETLSVKIGGIEVKAATAATLEKISSYLKKEKEVLIEVDLACGSQFMTFWGCDLTEGYVKENAYYTT